MAKLMPMLKAFSLCGETDIISVYETFVAGSIPARDIKDPIAQWTEHLPSKQAMMVRFRLGPGRVF